MMSTRNLVDQPCGFYMTTGPKSSYKLPMRARKSWHQPAVESLFRENRDEAEAPMGDDLPRPARSASLKLAITS